jgi:hypothetical protein
VHVCALEVTLASLMADQIENLRKITKLLSHSGWRNRYWLHHIRLQRYRFTNQESICIINKSYPNYSRYRKWSWLFCMHSWHFCYKFTFIKNFDLALFLSNNNCVCLHFVMIVQIVFLFGNLTFWNFCWNLLLTFLVTYV